MVFNKGTYCLVFILLSSCGTSPLVPVEERTTKAIEYAEVVVEIDRVLQSGLVLSSSPPAESEYTVRQSLKRPVKKNTAAVDVVDKVASKKVMPKTKLEGSTFFKWYWPLKGKVVKKFDESKGQKGIDIEVGVDKSVRAARAGKVIYVGSGLKGYGKLIIIKHDLEYITAYARNKKIVVVEGQLVDNNEKVAEIGFDLGRKSVLHFQTRYKGKAINPMQLLTQ